MSQNELRLLACKVKGTTFCDHAFQTLEISQVLEEKQHHLSGEQIPIRKKIN